MIKRADPDSVHSSIKTLKNNQDPRQKLPFLLCRDLMLAGTQQSVELKLALDQEQQKSKKLEESMRKLDEEMRRTDELLYQMIPKQVADRLRTGENPIDTCEVSRLTDENWASITKTQSNFPDVWECVHPFFGCSDFHRNMQPNNSHGSRLNAEWNVFDFRYTYREKQGL